MPSIVEQWRSLGSFLNSGWAIQVAQLLSLQHYNYVNSSAFTAVSVTVMEMKSKLNMFEIGFQKNLKKTCFKDQLSIV